MFQQLRPAILMLIVLTVLTGGVYPLVVTVIAQTIIPHQANGSLISIENRQVGSELIGQQFGGPRYFWGRLSATGPVAYNAAASSGSNLGPLNPALKSAVEARIAALKSEGSATGPHPVDLVTASGSGLDPHISPAAAEYQVARVAKARGIEEGFVRELAGRHTEGRQWGFLGEPRVNVLLLNLALDQLKNRQ